MKGPDPAIHNMLHNQKLLLQDQTLLSQLHPERSLLTHANCQETFKLIFTPIKNFHKHQISTLALSEKASQVLLMRRSGKPLHHRDDSPVYGQFL